jgi:hypothetical protein
MLHDVIKQPSGYPDKPENGVVDNLDVVHGCKITKKEGKYQIYCGFIK